MRPFKDEKINSHMFKRTVFADSDEADLVWQKDKMGLKIKVIQSGGWMIQFGEEPPIKMVDMVISKGQIYRIVKGAEDLILEIEEF